MPENKIDRLAEENKDLVLTLGEVRFVPTLTGDCNIEVENHDGCEDDGGHRWTTAARAYDDMQVLADWLLDVFGIQGQPEKPAQPGA